MPHQVKLAGIPGYAAHAARDGETVSVVVREFTSTEDGALFVSRLEGIPNDILNLLPREGRVLPSQIDHLLAVIERDGTATVYINEIPLQSSVRVKRAMKAGELVSGSDIADISRIHLGGIDVPVTSGVVFLFSCGWRQGLFFDVGPIAGADRKPREYELELALGQYQAYLLFQHLFTLSENAWDRLTGSGWFPFIRLSVSTVKRLVSLAEGELDVDEVLPTVEAEIRDGHDARLDRWREHPILAEHLSPLETALERYQSGDYCSAISILFTKIEGVLRSHHALAKSDDASQANLAKSAISGVDTDQRPFSLLMPDRFHEFLLRVYFAGFDSVSPSGVSRNTVGHGVVPTDEYTAKWAVIAILTLDQLAFFLSSEAPIGSAVR